MNWDPKKAARVDREQKKQRENKRIDYRHMNDEDYDDDFGDDNDINSYKNNYIKK